VGQPIRSFSAVSWVPCLTSKSTNSVLTQHAAAPAQAYVWWNEASMSSSNPTGGDLELGWFLNPEANLANECGRIAWYHNTKRLATAHSLGMMPDYLRGLISFNKITGLVRIKGLTSSQESTRERVEDTDPEWDVCKTRLNTVQGISPNLLKRNPSILLGGAHGRISYKINVKRLSSLWPLKWHGCPLVNFNTQTGLIEFAGLDFDLAQEGPRFEHQNQPRAALYPAGVTEREVELWEEFKEWRAKNGKSTFITNVWEPLEEMRGTQFTLGSSEIIQIVSTAIKRHYKLIALFRTLSHGMKNQTGFDLGVLEDDEDDYDLNHFDVIQARLREVTGFNGFHPTDMAIINWMIPEWRKYYEEIAERLGKLVEEYCPEAPKIAQYLLERYKRISVQLDAKNFCPYQYHEEAHQDPVLHQRLQVTRPAEDLDSSDSGDEMSEDE
ncbi:hypothetical protein QBC39DRAFT_420826, partial [Podospora conica]